MGKGNNKDRQKHPKQHPKQHPKKEAKEALLVRGIHAMGMSPSPRAAWALGWVQAILVAVVAAWFVLTFIGMRMTVPTGSMEPTISTGTSFFVDKVSYFFREPERGDIVVFWKRNEDTGRRERLVKRLVAQGGDSVHIVDCRMQAVEVCGVYVNGQKLDGPQFQWPYTASGQMGDQAWDVPEGHYFLLGDNSLISEDSRYWGFASEADVIGEPFLRVWPLNEFGFMNGYFGAAN